MQAAADLVAPLDDPRAAPLSVRVGEVLAAKQLTADAMMRLFDVNGDGAISKMEATHVWRARTHSKPTRQFGRHRGSLLYRRCSSAADVVCGFDPRSARAWQFRQATRKLLALPASGATKEIDEMFERFDADGVRARPFARARCIGRI